MKTMKTLILFLTLLVSSVSYSQYYETDNGNVVLSCNADKSLFYMEFDNGNDYSLEITNSITTEEKIYFFCYSKEYDDVVTLCYNINTKNAFLFDDACNKQRFYYIRENK